MADKPARASEVDDHYRRDRILLSPERECRVPAAYHRIARHELGHWTGHPHRLAKSTLVRRTQSSFASPDYARQELQAEIGSLAMGDRLGTGLDPSRHAAYLGAWIELLRYDPREIFRAAIDSRKSVRGLRAPFSLDMLSTPTCVVWQLSSRWKGSLP